MPTQTYIRLETTYEGSIAEAMRVAIGELERTRDRMLANNVKRVIAPAVSLEVIEEDF